MVYEEIKEIIEDENMKKRLVEYLINRKVDSEMKWQEIIENELILFKGVFKNNVR